MRRPIRDVTLKHLSQSGHFASGNPRLYYKPKGQKGVAMPDLPEGHPRFIAAWAAAAGAKPPARIIKGTLAAAFSAYLGSPAYLTGLKAATRAVRRRAVDQMIEKHGHAKASDLCPEHILKDLSRYQNHARNNRLKVWKHFTKWMASDDSGLRIKVDPAAGVTKIKTDKSDGHLPWTDDDKARFWAFWPIGTRERPALELINWTGARVSDAIRLGPQHVDKDGFLDFTQVETGGDAIVPFNGDLPDFAEGMAGDLSLFKFAISARNEWHLTYLHTNRGAARSGKAVSQWFARKARQAGIVGKTAHGLRKSRAQSLVAAGGTVHQAAAWMGHESLAMLQHYAKRFDKRQALTKTKPEPKVSTSVNRFQIPAKKEG